MPSGLQSSPGPVMRAAVFHGAGDVRVVARPVPVAAAGEVLVRVATVGICGTDAHEFAAGPRLYAVDQRHPVTGHVGPLAPGHEFSGTIEALGPGVVGPPVGTLVVCGAGISCGACRACRDGRTNLCSRYATIGIHRDGALAEFVAVPAETCVPAEGLRPDTAALAQPMAIASHAVRRGRARRGETAVVVGVGGIGVFLVHALHATGVHVVAVDLDASRLAVAAALGAELTIDASREDRATVLDGIEQHLRARGSSGPDVVLEVSGSAPGLDTAMALAGPGCRIVLVGIHGSPRELALARVTVEEMELLGTQAHVLAEDLQEAVRLLRARPDGWADVAPSVLPLDLLVEGGLAPMAEGRAPAIKTLIDPSVLAVRAADHHAVVEGGAL